MAITRADCVNPRFSAKDRAEMQMAVDNYLSNEEWAVRQLGDIGVLMLSHNGHKPYLTSAVKTHKQLGLPICLVYDNCFIPGRADIDYNSILPARDVMDDVDTFVMPHYQSWGGVSYPYFWQLKFGSNVMSHHKYIYCTNGDCVLEKPENFPELLSLMGDADYMGTGPDADNSVNTVGFIVRSDAFRGIVRHFQDHFIPLDNYEKYAQEFGNTEGRFARAIKDLGLKVKKVDPPTNEHLIQPLRGTWYDLIGYRHIHGECNWAYRYHGIPPEPKYIDQRYAGDYQAIKDYWDTKDMKILESWWAKD